MRKNNVRKLFVYGCFGGIIIGMLGSMYGCTNNRHAVIAVTGTNIGVEISQNPANQSPQAKLGYQRSEVAIVPSNRSGGIEPAGTSTVGHGASDVANVLMELKFSNIFSINTSGIYQRLAVGKTAVSQDSAAFMFARDQKGNLDPETAAAISGTYLRDESSDLLRKFWDQGNGDRLSEWMRKNGVNCSIPYFIDTAEYSEKRKQAVQHFGLK